MIRGVGRKDPLVRLFPDSNKGLSTVITSLLLILLSLVAIGIIWVVVKNLMDNATGGISFDGFSLNLGIKNAYKDAGEVKVIVRRTAGVGNLTGIYFIFSDGTLSSNVKRSFALKELEERTFSFSSTEVGGIDGVKTVSVSPIYLSGGKDTIGGITDTAEIRPFPPTGNGTTGYNQSNDTVMAYCGNQICEALEDSSSCPLDCPAPPSCNGVWDGAALESPNADCDGGLHCLAGCACSAGFIPDGNGGCVSEPSLNRGVIGSVWPLGAVKYIDSGDLPKNSVQIVSYIGKYANFSGAGGETRCLMISYAEYLDDPSYNKSYVRLELPSTVLSGDIYEIWISSSCGA